MAAAFVSCVDRSSEFLTDAIDSNQRFFKQFLGDLDSISKKIKSVEQQLKECGICVPYAFPLSRSFAVDEDHYACRDYLFWKKDSSGNFRLILGQSVSFACGFNTEEVLEIAGTSYYIAKEVPLIEAKAEIRLMYYGFLSDFYVAFGKALENRRLDYTIPF